MKTNVYNKQADRGIFKMGLRTNKKDEYMAVGGSQDIQLENRAIRCYGGTHFF